MDVQTFGLEAGEAIGDDLEPFAPGIEVLEFFLQAEVAQVIGTKLIAEETRELLVLLWPEAKTDGGPYPGTSNVPASRRHTGEELWWG